MKRINEFIDDDGKLGVCFFEMIDYIHFEELTELIKQKIQPDRMKEIKHLLHWHSSEIESEIRKDGLIMILELDKFDTITLRLESENSEANIFKFRELVNTIIRD